MREFSEREMTAAPNQLCTLLKYLESSPRSIFYARATIFFPLAFFFFLCADFLVLSRPLFNAFASKNAFLSSSAMIFRNQKWRKGGGEGNLSKSVPGKWSNFWWRFRSCVGVVGGGGNQKAEKFDHYRPLRFWIENRKMVELCCFSSAHLPVLTLFIYRFPRLALIMSVASTKLLDKRDNFWESVRNQNYSDFYR